MKCFVIMPFSKTCHLKDGVEKETTKEEWDYIFTDWIKKAVESFLDKKISCIRSGANPGNFIKGIVQDISSCDIVIADLTGQKANVYYELGIRHALKLGTITISQDLNAVPSDLKSYHCFEYTYTDKAHLKDSAYSSFEKRIHDDIRYIISNPLVADNPVADFVKIEQYIREEQIKLKQREFVELIKTLIKIAVEADKNTRQILKNKPQYLVAKSFPPNIINPHLFSALYSNFISGGFLEIMPVEKYKTMGTVFENYCNMYYSISQVWNYASITSSFDTMKNCIKAIEDMIEESEKVHKQEKFNSVVSKFENKEITFEQFLS